MDKFSIFFGKPEYNLQVRVNEDGSWGAQGGSRIQNATWYASSILGNAGHHEFGKHVTTEGYLLNGNMDYHLEQQDSTSMIISLI